MPYQFGHGIWASVFAVPCDIVDMHIKLCSPLSLKVLMVMLRHGANLELEELAEKLGQSRADIQDALNYWISSGIIFTGENSPKARIPLKATPSLSYIKDDAPMPAPSKTSAARQQGGERKIERISTKRQKLSTQEINEMAEKDTSIGFLLQESQQIFGDTLTPIMTDTVVALYSYYGMSVDLIMMLVQYCISIGKGSVRYIEKMAAVWMEQGIDSHELAEMEIQRLTRLRETEGRVKSIFGIYDRNLVTKEKDFISVWTNQFHMDIPMIELAFERCVENTGKLSFSYINGILANWHSKGVSTPAEAMKELAEGKKTPQAAKGKKSTTTSSYDMESLENLISFGDLSD